MRRAVGLLLVWCGGLIVGIFAGRELLFRDVRKIQAEAWGELDRAKRERIFDEQVRQWDEAALRLTLQDREKAARILLEVERLRAEEKR